MFVYSKQTVVMSKPTPAEQQKSTPRKSVDKPTPMQQDKPQQRQTIAESSAVVGDNAETNASKTSSTKKKSGVKRETRTIGQFYEWNEEKHLLEQFQPSYTDADFVQLSAEVAEEAESYEVTLDDVLKLPANVMNQREVEKLRQVAAKYAELRDSARVALGNLLASAQVNAKQREAKALKRKLIEDRKARRDAKEVK